MGEDGDFVPVEDSYAFYQIITQLLECQTGSEIWNQYYGFDLEEAIRINSDGAPANVIEGLLADALDDQKERLIFTIDYIKGERDGQQMNIKFSVQSKLGSIVATQITLGETLIAV
jgi:hypothetical protein